MENVTEGQGAEAAPFEGQAAEGQPAVVPGHDSNSAGNAAGPAGTGASALDSDRLASIEKSYKELQAAFTRTSQDRAELRKQYGSLEASNKEMAAMLAKAFDRPHDPQRFMEDLAKQGPNYIKQHVQQMLAEARKQDAEQMGRFSQNVDSLTSKMEVAERRSDSENYPNFKELEPEMNEVCLDPNSLPRKMLAANPTMNTSEFIDSLYQFVRLQHSQDALKAAENHGERKATMRLAKEASTAVAGGGKAASASPTDPRAMNEKQLREYFVSRGMVE